MDCNGSTQALCSLAVVRLALVSPSFAARHPTLRQGAPAAKPTP